MKLKEIQISNFRQFYGNQKKIDFSSGEKNITIIFGENGNGKTGIFRALVFALFGECKLAQDNTNDDIHLVNMLKLDESLGNPVEASVSVKFSHGNLDYSITRRVMGVKDGVVIREKLAGAELTIVDENGNLESVINEDDEIMSAISNIVDRNIKDFFFFDGEKIETLTKTDKTVREEIKTGIVKLLSIDKIERAIEILKDIHRKEAKVITDKSSNIDIKNAQKKKDEILDEIIKVDEKINILEKNLESCINEISRTKNKLNESKPVLEIQKKIDAISRENELIEANLITHRKNLKSAHFSKLQHQLLSDNYQFTDMYLKQQLLNQADIVSIEVVNKILDEMKCICGCDLNANDANLRNIERIKYNYTRSMLTPFIGMMSSEIGEILSTNDRNRSGILEVLKKINEFKSDIESNIDLIKSYEAEIKGQTKNEENLRILESTLEKKNEEHVRLKLEIETLKEKDLVKLEELLKSAERELEKLISADLSLKLDQKKLRYYKRLIEEFERMFNSYTDQMRVELMENATSIFKRLIDNKDRALIERIEINNKYEIELHNWNGTRITQDISQGQKQVVALSFITSLAKVAAGSDTIIDFPLFMDTPFGRMSGQNRDNLIKHIPNLSSQWILLLTDTEFTFAEEVAFKSTNKLGKWYRLDQKSVGHTEIIEVDIENSMARR